MSHDFDALARRLAPHYSRFGVEQRLLFTGHSHQAWPDVALEGQIEAFDAAARHVDDKWRVAFEKTTVLRDYLRAWYSDPQGRYCLAPNTHALLISWLSALDHGRRRRIVTTRGEFHSLHRQLHRFGEAGVDVVMVEVEPLDGFMDRLSAAVNGQTLAVMLSRVMFETSLVNDRLAAVADLARDRGAALLIDDYHGTNVVPLSIAQLRLEDCYLVTGGYKYLQWGEGNCFLRYPADCVLRPVITGWYASFSALGQAREKETEYTDPEQRFAGATYDPTSQFRAARVVQFFREQGLTPELLHAQYAAQTGLMREIIEAAGLDRDALAFAHQEGSQRNGGFLALRSPKAGALRHALAERGVYADARGDVLRLGMAPYVRRDQIESAAQVLVECTSALP